jgi:predicted nucleotidyltransferase
MPDILETLTKFKQQFLVDGVEIVGIFGSVARNEATPTSDIDIAYKLSKEKFFAKYRGFEAVSKIADIKNELSSQLHKKVDFVSIENSNQELVNAIKKELIYV